MNRGHKQQKQVAEETPSRETIPFALPVALSVAATMAG
jgi:hypothetical protein